MFTSHLQSRANLPCARMHVYVNAYNLLISSTVCFGSSVHLLSGSSVSLRSLICMRTGSHTCTGDSFFHECTCGFHLRYNRA